MERPVLTQKEVDEILSGSFIEPHSGMYRYDFSNVCLRNVSFKDRNICCCDFTNSELNLVNFENSNISICNFNGALIDGCNFNQCVLSVIRCSGAIIRFSTFVSSKINTVHCTRSSIFDCNFTNAVIKGNHFVCATADDLAVTDADFINNMYERCDGNTLFNLAHIPPDIPMACPASGSFIGWKATEANIYVKLFIPKSALRSSATSNKCRCNKAFVLGFYDETGKKLKGKRIAYSKFNHSFEYRLHRFVKEPAFRVNRWETCAQGIHFFMTLEQAVGYNRYPY